MERFTDKLLLRTNFGKKIVADMVARYIKTRFEKDAKVMFGEIDAEYDDEDDILDINIQNLHIETSGKDLLKLLNT